MKAIKRWLPFMGLREEKMSIKLILLERMKQEAAWERLALVALWEACVRVCVSVWGRPSLPTRRRLWGHQQGHREGRTTASTRHQFRACTPPSLTSPPPPSPTSLLAKGRWLHLHEFIHSARDAARQMLFVRTLGHFYIWWCYARSGVWNGETVSICSGGSPQWGHYPPCEMYLWNCCGEILYGSLKWRVWEVNGRSGEWVQLLAGWEFPHPRRWGSGCLLTESFLWRFYDVFLNCQLDEYKCTKKRKRTCRL